jgi:hypothetical protein
VGRSYRFAAVLNLRTVLQNNNKLVFKYTYSVFSMRQELYF